MKPLALTSAAATVAVRSSLIAWGTGELIAARRRRGSRGASDPSYLAISAAIGLGIAGAFVVAGTVRGDLLPGGRTWPVVAGLALLWSGIALRAWSIRTLGRFFTYVVQVAEDQYVVESGPYRLVRHPSYSGLLLTFVGLGLALGSWLSLAVAVAFPLAGVLIRIRVEEAALSARLGDEYRAYAAGRKRLVPGVW